MVININQDILYKIENSIKKDNIEKIVVGGLIIQNNNILLLKRASHDFMGDLVELPSGAMEQNETIFEALKREIKEETNLDIQSINKYIGFFDYKSSSGKNTRQLNFVIIVDENNSLVTINNEEHSAYYWCPLTMNEINNYNISKETKNIITKIIK